nr:fatty acid desaturase [Stagnihabitans tardus]
MALLVATYLTWGLGTALWAQAPWVSVILTGVAIAQFSSLQHEALHGHPFRSAALNEALVFPAFALFIPYRRFVTTHLQHHYDPALTDPHDDPESNFLEPATWASLSKPVQILFRLNNTLLGRILIGPILGTGLWLWNDLKLIAKGDAKIARDWGMNLLGLVPVLWWLHDRMPLTAYLGAVYLGFGLLKIRTFLEHRAHEAHRARTVVIEDRGPLSLLFLNNNFHVVHHMHPQVPWYKLPAHYAARKDHFQKRNDHYLYRSYGEVFRRYFLRAKDPVAHPHWPVRRD